MATRKAKGGREITPVRLKAPAPLTDEDRARHIKQKEAQFLKPEVGTVAMVANTVLCIGNADMVRNGDVFYVNEARAKQLEAAGYATRQP